MEFPFVFENISNKKDIKKIINYLDNNQSDFGDLSDSDYWKGRSLFYQDIKDEEVKEIMLNCLRNVLNVLKDNKHKVYCENFNIARWPVGYELLPHADAENPSGCEKHPYPWRDFGMATFLNENFEGGTLYYTNKNTEVKPKVGYTAIHSGSLDCEHGVTKITSGSRYTIAAFFTYDESKKVIDI